MASCSLTTYDSTSLDSDLEEHDIAKPWTHILLENRHHHERKVRNICVYIVSNIQETSHGQQIPKRVQLMHFV